MAAKLEDVRQILAESRAEIMARPNVVATGVGYKFTAGRQTDELAIICSVDTKQAKQNLSAREMIPALIGDVPTDVYVSGIIYALQPPTGRFRPAPGGVSIGHVNITAGTLGCRVQKDGKYMVLSNNHVLANSNDGSIGDPILQPGPTDGGSFPSDHFARLANFIPIKFAGGGSTCAIGNAAAAILNGVAKLTGSSTRLSAVYPQAEDNLVDCAIAEPLNPDDLSDEILNIGQVAGVAEGGLGMSVKKSGRTTGFTTGSIQQIDVTSTVTYGSNKTATFVDQLMAGAMSAGGDSGSAVLNDQNELVGLLFAGSNTTTLFNRIQNVFQALQISL